MPEEASDVSSEILQKQQVAQKAMAFRNTFKTLILSTSNTENQPLTSYTPFVRFNDNRFGIFISNLSEHTKNLRTNNKLSVMMIEPEAESSQIFARTRLIYQCTAEFCLKGSDEETLIINSLEKSFGKIMQQLKQLPDFNACYITPSSANFVCGFAQAYSFKPGEFENSLL